MTLHNHPCECYYLLCLHLQDFSVESAVALTLQEVKNKYKALLVIDCPPGEELPPGLKVRLL